MPAAISFGSLEPGLGDALERDDHAGDRTDQPEQRARGHREPQERLEPLELRHFLQHGLGDAQLDDFRVLLLLESCASPLNVTQHAAERVVGFRRDPGT